MDLQEQQKALSELGVMASLHEASRVLDRFWEQSLTSNAHAAALCFGEASFNIHKAIIALESLNSL